VANSRRARNQCDDRATVAARKIAANETSLVVGEGVDAHRWGDGAAILTAALAQRIRRGVEDSEGVTHQRVLDVHREYFRAQLPGVVDHVRENGRLPRAMKTAGAKIVLRILVQARGRHQLPEDERHRSHITA
jgi:hypothetical protein